MVNIGHKSQLNLNDLNDNMRLFSNKKATIFFQGPKWKNAHFHFFSIQTDLRANEWLILSVR